MFTLHVYDPVVLSGAGGDGGGVNSREGNGSRQRHTVMVETKMSLFFLS